MTVDQWYEVSFAIEDKEAAQVKHSYYIQERYAQSAGYTMAKKLEVALADLFKGFDATVGASTAALADSDIRAAISALEAVGIDTTSDVAFFVSPAVKQIAAFSRKVIEKLCKFRENLFETILGETSQEGRATTIITYLTPSLAR